VKIPRPCTRAPARSVGDDARGSTSAQHAQIGVFPFLDAPVRQPNAFVSLDARRPVSSDLAVRQPVLCDGKDIVNARPVWFGQYRSLQNPPHASAASSKLGIAGSLELQRRYLAAADDANLSTSMTKSGTR